MNDLTIKQRELSTTFERSCTKVETFANERAQLQLQTVDFHIEVRQTDADLGSGFGHEIYLAQSSKVCIC